MLKFWPRCYGGSQGPSRTSVWVGVPFSALGRSLWSTHAHTHVFPQAFFCLSLYIHIRYTYIYICLLLIATWPRRTYRMYVMCVLYVCMYVCMYVCYVCMYVCTYACMSYIYIYIYIYRIIWSVTGSPPPTPPLFSVTFVFQGGNVVRIFLTRFSGDSPEVVRKRRGRQKI